MHRLLLRLFATKLLAGLNPQLRSLWVTQASKGSVGLVQDRLEKLPGWDCPESISCSVVSDSLQPHGLYSLPSSTVHGILQARILEWVAIPFSKGSSQPRDWIQISHIAGRFFTIWATREASRGCPTDSKILPYYLVEGKHSTVTLPGISGL